MQGPILTFNIVTSLTQAHTWFLFRQDGPEIKITAIGENNYITSKPLTAHEDHIFQNYYL